MSCAHEAPAEYLSAATARALCSPCATAYTKAGGTLSPDPVPGGGPDPLTMCEGWPPRVKLAPFKPGEDEISDKARSTLGRLFEGDITE